MNIRFEVLVPGSSLAFDGGFFGISSIVLVSSSQTTALFDCGHGVTRRMLLQALARRDLTPADIDLLVFSHCHFDHVLNLDLFPNAPIIMSRDERCYVDSPFEEDTVTPRYMPALLRDRDVRLVEGEEELFSGVVAFPTPGHSPGHISLQLATSDGPTVLAADALKTAREALTGIPDLEFDPLRRGAASIQEVLRRGQTIIPGHFPVLTKHADGKISWTDVQEMPLLIR